MNSKSILQTASGGHTNVPDDWMPATGGRAFIFQDPAILWLNHFGEAHGFTKDTSPFEFLDFISEKGREFERKWIAEMANEAVRVCEKEYEVREVGKLEQTLDLIKEQVPLIAGAAIWWAPEKIYGVPDLLVHTTWLHEHFPELELPSNQPGHYVVFDMKFTTKLDSTQKKLSFVNYSIQTRIYSYIIGQIVNVMPTNSFLICRDRISNPLMVDIRSEVGKLLDEDIRNIRDKYLDIMLNGSSYTPWTHDQVCINLVNDQDYPWHSAKLDIARNKILGGDTALVYEIGQKQKEDLAKQGFPNRDSLLERDPNDIPLESCHGLGAAKCPRIRAVLQANRTGEVTPTSISSVPTTRPLEFFVDFETFNNLNVNFENEWPVLNGCEMIFMIGVGWSNNDEWKFEVFIAEEESHNAEHEMLLKFQSFLDKMTNDKLTDLEASVLYHWTNAEIWQLRNAANRHGLDDEHPLRKLPWYDLQKDVFLKEPIGVPGAWSYGLKNIATALGVVNWPGDLGDGLRATVAGWKAYQTTSPLESDEMQIITEYNEVDCRALYEILSWMRNEHMYE